MSVRLEQLNIRLQGLLKCGLDADAGCQMCSWKPWKSPWCCHIYKLLSAGSLLDVWCVLLYSEGRLFRENWCEPPSCRANVARSLLEMGRFAERRTCRGISKSCTFMTFLADLMMRKMRMTFVAVGTLACFVKNYSCILTSCALNCLIGF